jgi:hypothetical protein
MDTTKKTIEAINSWLLRDRPIHLTDMENGLIKLSLNGEAILLDSNGNLVGAQGCTPIHE